MDLVDEQDVARFEVRQQRRQVSGPFDHGATGGAELGAELGGNDPSERGLAEPRRAVEQHVVECLTTRASRLDEDRQVLPQPVLPDHLFEVPRAQRLLDTEFVAQRLGRQRAPIDRLLHLLAPHLAPPLASPRAPAAPRESTRQM